MGESVDGEADFLLLHPAYGILVLEVKGGIISQEGRAWYQINTETNRKERLRKSPAKQARDSSKALISTLKRSPLTKNLASRIPVGYSVWFTKTDWQRATLTSFEGQEYFILDKSDLARPEKAITQVFEHFAKRVRQPDSDLNEPILTEDYIEKIIDIIEPDTVARASLAQAFTQHSGQATVLTPQQFEQLRKVWRGQKQMLITGEAGTGKTLLALEIASRLADEGFKILVLVKSPLMANWLNLQTELDHRPDKPKFEILDLRALVHKLASKGRRLQDKIEGTNANTFSGQNELKRIMEMNIPEIERNDPSFFYDGVIVDDGEDFEQPLSVIIQKLLRDRRNGFYYVFYDVKQQIIIQDRWRFGIANHPRQVNLKENWRNSKAVFDLMSQFNPALLNAPQISRPLGMVLFKGALLQRVGGEGNGNDEIALLKQALMYLRGDEIQLAPDDIAIVTMKGRASSFLQRAEERNKFAPDFQLRWLEADDHFLVRKGKVGIVTIEQVKGLEFKGVILIELDGLDYRNRKSIREKLGYVGVSRARQYLIVLGDQNQLIQPTLWS